MGGALSLEMEAATALQIGRGDFYVHCDPQLAEAAVHAVVRGSPLDQEYHREREACYQREDSEGREHAFATLSREWFNRLRLAAPVMSAIGERPTLSALTSRCVVAPALGARDETAELYGHAAGPNAGRPTLLIRLRPESFAYPGRIVELLRHELMHISDMLDPAFEYDPSPSQFLQNDGIPTVIRDRYRVLWDTFIDGRLEREGRGADNAYARRAAEFCAVFKVFAPDDTVAFDRVFSATVLTHPQLIHFAHRPVAILGLGAAKR